jgi:signal transduction histidine kinase
MLGKSLHQIFDKENADFFMAAITKCIKTKQRVILDYKLEINSKISWFLARISYISDTSVLSVAHDNTTKMIAEEKLKKSEKSLLELNATKDKLFSIIAHDLRSPFNTTLGLVEMLEKEIDIITNEEIKESIEVLAHSLKSQFKLLENLLNWARLQTGKMEIKRKEIHLNKFTDDVIDLLSSTAKTKNITIVNNIEKEVIISADENMLRSIISNLISNALKFTNDGGSVTISSKSIGSSYEITVSDTGIGMKENDIATIFNIDKLHTTLGTAGEKGTGLGLALVKEMVEKHNGNISVISEVGKGTKFIFTLS